MGIQPEDRLAFIKVISDVIEELEAIKQRLERLEEKIIGSNANGNRQRLAELLARHFSIEELDSLAFELNLNGDYEGEGSVSAKARRLVQVCERRLLLEDMIIICKEKRPRVRWPSV